MILFMWLDLFTRMYYMYFCTHLLLYADDLAVIAETEEELIKTLNEWKNNVESKGMRDNMNKTKIMISGERQKVRQKTVRVRAH